MIRIEIVSPKMKGRMVLVDLCGVPRVGETIILDDRDDHLTVIGVAWRTQPGTSGVDVTIAVREGW